MTIDPVFIHTCLAGAASFLSAYAALAIVQRRRRTRVPATVTRLLFDEGRLIDATPGGAELLARDPALGDDLTRLGVALSPLFPDLPSELCDATGTRHLSSRDGTSELTVHRHAERTDVSVRTVDPEGVGAADRAAQEAELELLRTNTDAAPFIAWREDGEGRVTWINRGYLDLARRVVGAERAGVWPLPALFGANKTGARQRIDVDGADPLWFQHSATPAGGDVLHTAVDVTETVRAEDRLRDFMQTLTKTFASLAIGLAVFNRERNLVLYNPALLDLTELPADFLTSRPSLTMVLDALRERQMMPEPRDYREWRDAIAKLEAAAETGNYAETWNLPDHRTYRVTGRPHPDGAIALMLEDISAEMSLTRRFRAELDLGQAILDEVDDALAAFSPSGVLTMSNLAYGRLWGTRPDIEMRDVTITDATRTWSEKSLPTPVWGDLRDYVHDTTTRSDWSATVQLADGRGLDCRFAPLAGGMTLASFRQLMGSAERGEPVELPPMRRLG